jgi:hypothetical protein
VCCGVNGAGEIEYCPNVALPKSAIQAEQVEVFDHDVPSENRQYDTSRTHESGRSRIERTGECQFYPCEEDGVKTVPEQQDDESVNGRKLSK